MPRTLALAAALRAELVGLARAATPGECCGLIEGVVTGEAARAIALHPARNLATRPDRFEIDPADHIRLLRTLRGTGRDIIGCYHSHPDGSPVPSDVDRDGAGEEDFIWLVCALGESAASFGAHVWKTRGFEPLVLTD